MSETSSAEKTGKLSNTSIISRGDSTTAGTIAQLDGLSLGEAANGRRSPERSPEVPQKDEKYLSSNITNEKQDDLSSSLKKSVTPHDWNEKEAYTHSENMENQHTADVTPAQTQPATQEAAEDSKSEIQSIMHQFEDGEEPLIDLEPTSSNGANLPVFQYPPRTSSLEHQVSAGSEQAVQKRTSLFSIKAESIKTPSASQDPEQTSLMSSPSVVSQPPPPEPDPEPTLPFDFHRFLEQLRHRTADPVAKFLRSFLLEFGKKQWMVHEQVKIISDFLTFISNRMGQCEVWRSITEAEFDNAREGMEKLVMNRLYTQTFSPEIVPAEPVVTAKFLRKPASAPLGPGRKGQHQEDVERDEVLAQKVRIYSWVREEHLDMKPFGEKGAKFLKLAQQELVKIKSYRAPRDKIICVLNCCKVLFGFLRNAESDQSADAFIPLLIYTVLKANPDHLVSNVQYILRFRNQDKLGGEAGYYMSSLMGAVQFIENLDRTNLTVTDEEFEKNVEAAVSAITEQNEQEEKARANKSPHLPFVEKSALSRPEVTPRNSMDGERASPRRVIASRVPVEVPQSSEHEEPDDAVTGLLRTIQKPLSSIGRMFSEELVQPARSADHPALTPLPGSTPRLSPSLLPRNHSGVPSMLNPDLPPGAAAEYERMRLSAADSAARQASAEAAEAHHLQRSEHRNVVETLKGMFPNLDRDVISDVVRMNDGRVGLAVDACLMLSH